MYEGLNYFYAIYDYLIRRLFIKNYQNVEDENVRKNHGMLAAIFGIIFTVLIAIWGATVYGSGRGVMTLFHTIELSPTAFAIIIVVLIVWDILSLVKAIKDRNR